MNHHIWDDHESVPGNLYDPPATTKNHTWGDSEGDYDFGQPQPTRRRRFHRARLWFDLEIWDTRLMAWAWRVRKLRNLTVVTIRHWGRR